MKGERECPVKREKVNRAREYERIACLMNKTVNIVCARFSHLLRYSSLILRLLKWIETEPDRKIQKKEKRKKARQNRTGPYTRVYDHELSSNENFEQFLHVGIDFGLNHKMTEDEMKGKFL